MTVVAGDSSPKSASEDGRIENASSRLAPERFVPPSERTNHQAGVRGSEPAGSTWEGREG